MMTMQHASRSDQNVRPFISAAHTPSAHPTRRPTGSHAPGKGAPRRRPDVDRHVFLQIQTTGIFFDGGDRIIELACVELKNREFTGHDKHFYLNPGCVVHKNALAVHGIANGFLRDKPTFATVANELVAYLQGAPVVMYCAAFTSGFLNMELVRLDKPCLAELTDSVTDILRLFGEFFPGRQHSLNAVGRRLGLSPCRSQCDESMLTAQLVADVYLKLTDGFKTQSE